MNAKKNVKESFIDFLIKRGLLIIFLVTTVIVLIAAFDPNNEGEASIGSFDRFDFNTGWVMTDLLGTNDVVLPLETEMKSGSEAYIVNVLPDYVHDGMSLVTRASLQDIYIYIDGSLREAYASEYVNDMSYYIPSAYVVTMLNDEDAGKEIKIAYRFKALGVINDIILAYGNNEWFYILKNSMPVNLTAIMVLILGIILLIVILLLGKTISEDGAAKYLGLLMVDVSLWVISESSIRQFIFNRPSLSHYFAYLTVEMIGALACLYFDAVQHKVFHKRYVIAELVVFSQLVINIVLQLTGIYEFYQSLVFSHIWTALCIVLAIVNIVTDIVTKRIKEYRVTAIGMICFVAMSVIELLGFYLTKFRVFGTFICIGLILLMAATIIQTLLDENANSKEKERKQSQITIRTIETIASAIDAKDEYAGGHSERVGFYAGKLAREMAADYDLSEEDILRIQYIGLIHDIGKIGVADNVLNKSGRLTDEEFSLMKKHSEIGYEIMQTMGDVIEGLLAGIKHHHERFDGKGYPDGLSDTDIPLEARILSLADSFDAMTSNRVYRKRLTDEEVRNELIRCSGTQFDPALTEIFIRLLDRGELTANTIDGRATDENGVVRSSALLEHRLQVDLLEKNNITNPTHIRMMCYIMKLMEKRGKDYKVLFLNLGSSAESDNKLAAINDFIKNRISNHDINIEYCENTKVISFFDKSDDEFDEFIDGVRQLGDDVSIEVLACLS